MSVGLAQMHDGDLDAARATFSWVYAQSRDPDALRYIGDAYRVEGAFEQAAVYYRRYLREADADAPARGTVAEYLEMIDRRARISTLSAAPTANADPARRRFWIAATTTGVGLIATTYAGIRANALEYDKQDQFTLWLADEDPDLSAYRPSESVDPDACAAASDHALFSSRASELNDTCEAGRRWARISNLALLGTGIAAGATAYYAYRAFWDAPESRDDAYVTPVVTPDGVGASLSLRF